MRTHFGLNGLISISGGLTYHARAIRYQRSIWTPFREDLGVWLAQWQPPEEELVILGPSAGHCFPFQIVRGFQALTLNDPDLLALRIFQKRALAAHSELSIRFHREDLLGPGPDGRFEWSPTLKGLEQFKGKALMFSNCLGQLPYLSARKDCGFKEWKTALSKWLSSRSESWCTYHDLYSAEAPFVVPDCEKESSAPIGLEQLRKYIPAGGPKVIEIEDHSMEEFLPGHARRLMTWQILPKRWHLIEGIRHCSVASLKA